MRCLPIVVDGLFVGATANYMVRWGRRRRPNFLANMPSAEYIVVLGVESGALADGVCFLAVYIVDVIAAR